MHAHTVPNHARQHTVPGLAPWIATQTALVTAGIVVYFGVRGLSHEDVGAAVDHGFDLLAVERTMGIAWESPLQHSLLRWDVVATVANWIYIYGHWPVIVPTLVWLGVRHRDRFLLLRDAMMVSGGIGLVIFAYYPVAPPRLLGAGFIDTVTERSVSYRVLQPSGLANLYAAMPSLHAGWDLLVGLAIAAVAGSAWLRWTGRLLPVLMAVAVVVTGNHYVLDVIAGLALALVGLAVAHAFEHRRAARARESGARSRAIADERGAPHRLVRS